jgi:ankyrin repeat protein
MEAAYNSSIMIVELLISRGADIKKKDKNGDTALIYATFHDDIADLLRKHGAKE